MRLHARLAMRPAAVARRAHTGPHRRQQNGFSLLDSRPFTALVKQDLFCRQLTPCEAMYVETAAEEVRRWRGRLEAAKFAYLVPSSG